MKLEKDSKFGTSLKFKDMQTINYLLIQEENS